jgi:hypothetical protein
VPDNPSTVFVDRPTVQDLYAWCRTPEEVAVLAHLSKLWAVAARRFELAVQYREIERRARAGEARVLPSKPAEDVSTETFPEADTQAWLYDKTKGSGTWFGQPQPS